MADWSPSEVDLEWVDAATAGWQQGDVFEGAGLPALRVIDPARPLSEAANRSSGPLVAEESDSVVLVSQTCDVVRSCRARPLVTVAPLVALDGDTLSHADRGRIPRYVAVPGAPAGSFADLDRLTTVEKSVLVGRAHRRGFRSDVEIREFGRAMARHLGRFAFPDDFTATIAPLADRLARRANRNSAEGHRVDEVLEIRVSAVGGWNSEPVEVELIFVVVPESLPPVDVGAALPLQQGEKPETLAARLDIETDPDSRASCWSALVQAWVDLCTPKGVIAGIAAVAATLDDISAATYLGTDALDLDHLSPTESGSVGSV